jgi:hypothetical protein
MTDDQLRDQLAIEYVAGGYGCDGDTSADSFKAGWDSARSNTQTILLKTENGSYTVDLGQIVLSVAKERDRLLAVNQVLINELEHIKWMGHPERAKINPDMTMYRCPTCDSAERATRALAKAEELSK